MEQVIETPQLGVPDLRAARMSDIAPALAAGWRDFLAKPIYGIVFGMIYVVAGWIMTLVTWETGHSFWLVLAAIGFPLLGPFWPLGFMRCPGVCRRVCRSRCPMSLG